MALWWLWVFGTVEAGFYDLIKPAKGVVSVEVAARASTDYLAAIAHDDVLFNHPAQPTPRYENVFDVVNAVHDMLPCNKIATSMLMNSCLQPADNGAPLLEALGTLYGTRLAVCELFNARADIPASCKPLVPTPELVTKATVKSFIRNGMLTDPSLSFDAYDSATAAASQKCTKALYSKPQTWTSFSNSKQNSLAICQAMRVEIEKGQIAAISLIS